jgi:hypothetical protein
LIAGDNRGALANQLRRQHDIVVLVATRWRLERVGRHDHKCLREQPDAVAYIDRTLMEFARQDIAKLIEQGREETTTW